MTYGISALTRMLASLAGPAVAGGPGGPRPRGAAQAGHAPGNSSAAGDAAPGGSARLARGLLRRPPRGRSCRCGGGCAPQRALPAAPRGGCPPQRAAGGSDSPSHIPLPYTCARTCFCMHLTGSARAAHAEYTSKDLIKCFCATLNIRREVIEHPHTLARSLISLFAVSGFRCTPFLSTLVSPKGGGGVLVLLIATPLLVNGDGGLNNILPVV